MRWYVCGVHELCQQDPEDLNQQETLSNENEDQLEKGTAQEIPLAFEWSGFEPLLGGNFNHYKDSLQAVFEKDPAAVVEITGFYDLQEINNSEFQNLGLARAQSVKDLLLASGIKRSINILAKPGDLSAGLGEKITNGIAFGMVSPFTQLMDFAIIEKNGKLIVTFPTNSESPESNAAVRDALRKIAQKAIRQGSSLLVVGHTDNQGEAMKNKVLGLVRATKIKDMLLESGMSEEDVLAESEGEEEPVVSNSTAQGRQQNRRVEIVII